jgi:DNA-binding NarL/FixJ family response regulator
MLPIRGFVAMELTERENAIVQDLGRGAKHGEVAYSNDMTTEELETALLRILGKLQVGAMQCVLAEPMPETTRAVVDSRELTAV